MRLMHEQRLLAPLSSLVRGAHVVVLSSWRSAQALFRLSLSLIRPLLRREQLPVLFLEHISSTKHLHYICRIKSREVRSLVLAVFVLDYLIWIH